MSMESEYVVRRTIVGSHRSTEPAEKFDGPVTDLKMERRNVRARV